MAVCFLTVTLRQRGVEKKNLIIREPPVLIYY